MTTDRIARLDQLAATMRDIALRAVADYAHHRPWRRSCAHESARWCAQQLVTRAERLAERNAPADVIDAVRDAASLVETFARSPRWTDADIHVAQLALAARGRL